MHQYARTNLINPGPLEMLEITRVRSERGAAPYVGDLMLRLRTLIPREESSGLEFKTLYVGTRTSLSEMFAERYDIDMSPYYEGSDGFVLNASGKSKPNNIYAINYITRDSSSSKLLWHLTLDADYGTIDMLCTGKLSGLPLAGAADVAFVPGIEEALRADIERFADPNDPLQRPF